MLEALVAGEIDAAVVTPFSAGYYNLAHPALGFVVLPDELGPGETSARSIDNGWLAAATGLRLSFASMGCGERTSGDVIERGWHIFCSS